MMKNNLFAIWGKFRYFQMHALQDWPGWPVQAGHLTIMRMSPPTQSESIITIESVESSSATKSIIAEPPRPNPLTFIIPSTMSTAPCSCSSCSSSGFINNSTKLYDSILHCSPSPFNTRTSSNFYSFKIAEEAKKEDTKKYIIPKSPTGPIKVGQDYRS